MTETAPTTDKEKSTKPLVGSLTHGLNIIMAFDRDHPAMTLSAVSERTGMDRAGARRYLLTLCHLGFVAQTGRLFCLTPKVMDLGYAYLSSIPVGEKAQPYLDSIRNATGFPIALGIRDGHDIVHIASANSDEFTAPALTIGRRFSLPYASAGRCILASMPVEEREHILSKLELTPPSELAISSMDALRAALDQARLSGYALVDQEMQAGIRSLAVPIFDRSGNVVASFNTFTFSSLVSIEQLLETVLPTMLEVAGEFGKTII
ncbi:IclR family transcriptional regulator domain-containing protein [Gluconobacter wancherniae]|uniref:IclR family transcriptional regulator domain-containing protein n=1 Tax=Gluconobacter wancherniae TaxID=1307955 RepID=UPI001B8C981F|nr:IclR family transcriptional regulator C-terminal domain-containing protein [Gluconobacter wancherniae]MBS1089708.1 helix-turn-helix domain-containing protein [Gluconobacter wancherniae]